MLSEKMQAIRKAITDCLFDNVPYEHLQNVFSSAIGINDLVDQVLLECIKAAFDSTQEKHSLRYYLSKREEYTDDVRMRYSRLITISNEYKKRELLWLQEQFGIPAEDDLPPEMNSIKDRLDGYQLTEMQFFEITNIGELELIKAIINHRLGSAKKISNEKFRRIALQYDKFAISLLEQKDESDEKMVFTSFAFFNIEWKYAFNFLYLCADCINHHGTTIDNAFLSVWPLIGYKEEMSDLGFSVSGDSRMVGYREGLIQSIFQDEDLIDQYREMFCLLVWLKENAVIDGVPIKDWFAINTDVHDWASFLREYNVFKFVNSNKHYSNRIIRNLRTLICQIFPENPDYRSYTLTDEYDNLISEQIKEVISMVRFECYIEEYHNEAGNLCARLRDKESNKKIVIAGDESIKTHLLRFLSKARAHAEIMPTVFCRDGTDIVVVRGIVYYQDDETIELGIDAPGAGYLFE